ncbi:MAG: glycine cleavage T C-terminal barrel domain-containing protein [Pseudomonadota bacterium]
MKAHGLNPRIRKSPFFASSIKYGATEFHPYNGMWMPVGYDTPVNEYWNTIERAGIWDVAVQRCVEIKGPDAEAFTNLLTVRDVSKVSVGQCRYIIMTNQNGGILNDPVMMRMADDQFWLSTADADMYLWAKGVSTYAGFNVEVNTPHVYPIQIQGPLSPQIVSTVFGDDILDLKYYHWMKSSVNGIEVVISRTGFSSEIGFEVYLLGDERGNELWETIMAIGAPLGLSPGSPNRIRRIEGGVLDFASDMTPDENPLEMGMERLIDFSKVDFIGKTALERARDEGVKRKVTGVFMSGNAFQKNNEHRWPVLQGNDQVGAISSAVYSPRLKRNIGFALLDAELDLTQAALRADTAEGMRDIEITRMPFVDPDKKLPRTNLREI